MPSTGARKPRRPKAPPREHARIASTFEDDVLAGRFPAGRLFRAAIERQRRDVANPPGGFTFDADRADRMCKLMELIPLGGEGPRRGQPFRLEPWQTWLVRVLFGWVDPVTGFPRFRTAHLWLCKGNGKSPLAALVALCVLIQGRGGEKVYSAASTQKQARHVFDSAREMLNLAPRIATRAGLDVEEHALRGVGDSRRYEPVSSEAGSIEGIRPSLLVLDEVHVLPNRKLYDNLRSAANKVDGSMFVTISTAGFDMSPQAIGWQLYSRTRDVLEGRADDPTLFAFIVEADRTKPDGTPVDPGSDWEAWQQANPNLGISVSVAGLKSAMQTWRDVPSERASLEVKHLGWWQATADAFLDARRWSELGDPAISLDDTHPNDGWSVTVGVDLARTRDLTAAVVVAARPREDGRREYRVFTRRTYLPAESPTVSADLRLWARQGWLTLIPGRSMSLAPLKEEIKALAERFPGLEVCVDDWGAMELESELQEAGVTVIAVRQGAKTLSEPMKELEAAVLDGRLTHDGSPVAAWCIGNLQAQRDANDNIRPSRESEHKKIDIAVALIDALVRARLSGSAPVYTATRGLFCVDFDEE